MLSPLYQRNYHLTLLYDPHVLEREDIFLQPSLLLLALTEEKAMMQVMRIAIERKIPWLVWNCRDHPQLTIAAYEAGASAVLPSSLTPAILQQAIGNSKYILNTDYIKGSTNRKVRSYQQEERIALEQDAVLEVLDGVIAHTVIHADGAQVLLGLCRPGQVVVGHPEDSCCIQLLAHTRTTVIVRPWDDAMKQPAFPVQLCRRLRQMEAWASVQARPYLDQRLLGILLLLAGQFGHPHPQGSLIDIRITHAQLASAVGATRTTVTRLLGDFRRRGWLAVVDSEGNERLCLQKNEQWESCSGR
jgi:hypothetical protein